MTKKADLEEILAKQKIKDVDFNNLKKLVKTSRYLKKAMKKINKIEKNYSTNIKNKKIEFYKESGLYNENYDLDSIIYDILIDLKIHKENIENLKNKLKEDENNEDIKQKIRDDESYVSQIENAYTLELLRPINLSLLSTKIIEIANNKLGESKKLFVNLNILNDTLMQATKGDIQLVTFFMLKLANFINTNDIDSYYNFIHALSQNILNINKDKTLKEIIINNIKEMM